MFDFYCTRVPQKYFLESFQFLNNYLGNICHKGSILNFEIPSALNICTLPRRESPLIDHKLSTFALLLQFSQSFFLLPVLCCNCSGSQEFSQPHWENIPSWDLKMPIWHLFWPYSTDFRLFLIYFQRSILLGVFQQVQKFFYIIKILQKVWNIICKWW